MMRRSCATLLLLSFAPVLLGATTPALDNRRIEQEKRDSLSVTETIISNEIAPAGKPQEPPELRYLKQILLKKVATLSDAFWVLSILLKQQERFPDFPRQFSYFQEHLFLPAGLSLQDADKPLRKGVVAYLFCKGLGIRGGVWLRVFGMSQRYALRELAYEGMISSGSIHEIVSGHELVALFVSAAEYLICSLAPVEAEGSSMPRGIDEEKRESLAFTEASVPQTEGRLVFDYGGWLNARYSDYRNDDKDDSGVDPIDDTTMLDCRLWLKAILMPPLGASYENKHSFYMRVKDLYSVSHPKETAGGSDNDGPHLDYAYALFDLQPLWIKAGRGYFTLGQGLAYSDAHDGVELLYVFPQWDLKTFASRTLPHQDNSDTSVPGFEKGSDRYFYGAEYGYLGIAGCRLYGYALMQRDESNEEPEDAAHDYTYDSEYLGVGIRGRLKTKVAYWWEFIRQTGKSVVYATDEKHAIEAWAQVVAVSYEPSVYAHPLCYLKYAFGSGDKDRVSTTDTQNGNVAGKDGNFLPFGFLPTGYAFSGQLSNLHMVKIGCTFKPLEGYRAMKGLSLGIDYYRYFKDKASGGIYDSRATEDNDDVGGEIDITLSWALTSDLHLSLQYGHFIPGKAYPASTDDSEHYFSVSSSIIF